MSSSGCETIEHPGDRIRGTDADRLRDREDPGYEGGANVDGGGSGGGDTGVHGAEQGMGKEIDGRADIYALGVVYYELITGHPPYSADTPVGVLIKSANDPLPRPFGDSNWVAEAGGGGVIQGVGKGSEGPLQGDGGV